MFLEQILTKEIGIVSLGVMFFVLALGNVPVGTRSRPAIPLRHSDLWKHYGWLFAIAFGVVAAFLPGVCPVAGQGWGAQVVWGIVAGGSAILAHKALKPAILKRFES